MLDFGEDSPDEMPTQSPPIFPAHLQTENKEDFHLIEELMNGPSEEAGNHFSAQWNQMFGGGEAQAMSSERDDFATYLGELNQLDVNQSANVGNSDKTQQQSLLPSQLFESDLSRKQGKDKVIVPLDFLALKAAQRA